MSKKRKIPNWDSYCSTNVNKSRVCWHKELHATRFLLIEVKRREKNKKKRRREFTRLQSAQQSALVSVGVNDRRETGDLSCRLRAPVGGRNAFSEDAQKFPAWLLLLCCCCCPPVFVSGITEGVTLASLPPLSPLSLAVCVYTLVSSTYLFSRSRLIASESYGDDKKNKRNKEKSNFFLSQGRAWLCVTAQRTKSNNNNNQKKKEKEKNKSGFPMTNDWKRMNDLGRHELVVRFCLFLFFSIDVM